MNPRLMAPWGPFLHRVDLVPFTVVMLIAAAQLWMYFGTATVTFALAGTMILWPVTTMSIAIAHSHFHVRTFRSTLLNRVYEFVLFYQSGMPSYAWPLNHNIGHHQHFMQQSARAPYRDEYYWMEPDGTVTPRWRYVLRTAGLSYWYSIRNGRLRPDYLRKAAVVMVLHALALGALLAYDAPRALICFVSVIAANMVVNAWFSYSHHAGLSLKDRYRASYSNLSRLENFFTFNTGYHTAHHVRASVHWYELPSFHSTIATRVPAQCYLRGDLTQKAAAAQLEYTRAEEAAAAGVPVMPEIAT